MKKQYVKISWRPSKDWTRPVDRWDPAAALKVFTDGEGGLRSRRLPGEPLADHHRAEPQSLGEPGAISLAEAAPWLCGFGGPGLHDLFGCCAQNTGSNFAVSSVSLCTQRMSWEAAAQVCPPQWFLFLFFCYIWQLYVKANYLVKVGLEQRKDSAAAEETTPQALCWGVSRFARDCHVILSQRIKYFLCARSLKGGK